MPAGSSSSIDTKNFESSFRMVGSKIIKFSYELAGLYEPESAKEKYSYGFNKVTSNSDDETRFSVIEITTKIRIKNEANKLVLKADLVIQGGFVANTGMEAEQFDRFLELNGAANLLQIARAFLVSTLSQCGMNQQIVIPMVNLFEFHRQNAGKNQDAVKD